MADNILTNRGVGQWQFTLYNPDNKVIGIFNGRLEVSKEHHVVIDKETGETVVSVPSQNVSFVVNRKFVE